MNVKLYIKNKEGDYVNVPLYNDESINYQSKISDAEDLETVFNDSTNSFTIPASSTTNAVFNYWFEIGVQPTTRVVEEEVGGDFNFTPNYEIEKLDFDIKRKIGAYIEISGVPYKYGVISLLNVEYKNGLPLFYKIEFYGSLIELSEKLKEDRLRDLVHLDEYNFEHNVENYLNSLVQPHKLKDGNVMTPLMLLTDKNINIINNDGGNFLTPQGAIKQEELRPAISVPAIIKAIEKQYGIKFNSNFLDRKEVKRLFMWLNKNKDPEDLLKWKNLPLNEDFTTNFQFSEREGTIEYDSESGIVTFERDMRDLHRFRGRSGIILTRGDELMWSFSFNLIIRKDTPGDALVKIRVRNLDTDEIVGQTEEWVTTLDTPISFYSNIKLFYNPDASGVNEYRYAVEYISKTNVQLRIVARFVNYCHIIESTPFQRLDIEEVENSSELFDFSSQVSIRDNIPDMKVSDFFKGLMDMFRLVIIPEEENGTYLLETINEYYESGNEINLTKYIDVKSHNSSVRKTFRELSFNWEESEHVLQQAFEREFGRQFGSLAITDNKLEGKKEVSLPFSNLMLSPFQVFGDEESALNIGLMQTLDSSGTLKGDDKGVFLFYYNGLLDMKEQHIYLDLFDVVDSFKFINNIDIVDSEFSTDITNMLSWGKEYSSSSLSPVERNLYNNYWKRWVDTLYNKDSRLVNFRGRIDSDVINNINLNSRIIVGNNAYNINELDINLTTNEFNITLFPNFQILGEPYSDVGVYSNIYSFSPAELYGTIIAPEFSEWEVVVEYHQGFDWLEFLIDGGVVNYPGTNVQEFNFTGRFLNLRVSENISTGVDGTFNRSASVKMINKETREEFINRIYQNGITA